MGEVWLARHRGGVPAALKFDLHPPDDQRREDFLHEVRLVAGLQHENCVLVFDAGVVGEEEQADGPVRAGAPWLAMELAPGGSVADRPPADWAETLHVFRGLFLGLAHAHARGVIHRDIKPGNLLYAGPRGVGTEAPQTVLEARIVLSDFGVSYLVDRPGTMDTESVGTPRYMAPEQIEARWRDQGPWTDLYQAGIMLWRLATGTFPFPQKQTVQLYYAHLFESPGEFVPRFDVPHGLEALCRRLLEKDPEDRPRFAADALRRLESLGEVRAGSGRGPVPVDPDLPTVVTRDLSRQPTTAPGGRDGALDMRLRGAGLGLWGLRPVPMVNRDDTREALWDALMGVERARMPGVVALTGPQGSGRSRLAAWLVEQAHETGRATAWRSRGGDEGGLDGMLRAELKLGGLDRADAAERLARHGEAATPLLRWLVDGERQSLSDRDRFALAERLLTATDRPRLVLLDEVQGSPDTLRFVLHALERVHHPLLFVLTCRDEELAASPEAAALVDRIVERERGLRIDVGPLSAEDHRELVRGMLGLEGELARQVELRTAGNPRFAVELVNGWIEHGVLEPGPRGLRLQAGASPSLPDDLVAVWAERAERFLATHTPADRAVLQIAATLGLEFAAVEWRDACRHAGLMARAGLLDELLSARWLRADERRQRLRWSHALLREELLTSARADGRERDWNDACAKALEGRPGTEERRATFLFHAGRYEEALTPLCNALDRQFSRGDHRDTTLLELLEEVPVRLGLPPSDPRWGDVWGFRAWWHRQRGEHIDADEILARTEEQAEQHSWKAQLGVALRDAGRTAMQLGQLQDALDSLTRAERLLTEVGRTETAGDCRLAMGEVVQKLGQLDRAEELYQSAIGCFDTPRGIGYAYAPYAALAHVYQRRGKLDLAAAYVKRARETATTHGQLRVLAQMANLEGEIARYRGDLDEAERCYHEAVRAYALLYDDEGRFPVLNLGLVRVLLGRHDEATDMVLPLLEELEQAGNEPVMVAYCHSVLLPAAAGRFDVEGFRRHARALELFLTTSGLADPDIARMCAIAADLVPDPRQATRARRLAAEQKQRLEN
ncbi:MAG: protein kinase [Myxococcales bacterium]|nr:protein kinase [Myxococcales bacterium]